MKFTKLTVLIGVLFPLGLFLVGNAHGQASDRPAVSTKDDAGFSISDPLKNNVQPAEDESALLPYYNNYLKEYHLGPEDVISVQVFGQPNYSKSAITIPPTARIAYPLIPEGIFVGGKTTEQIAREITKSLDEYIIDPQVTVTLDKVGSARFGVLGKVAVPGVRVMNRRFNLYEAIVEAGGITKEGDGKRVLVVRLTQQGTLSQKLYNLDKVIGGQDAVPYLMPGDQVIVPEKRWSLTKILDVIGKASAARMLMGIPY